MAMSIDNQIAAASQLRDNYWNALLADSTNPQPNYNFDGQTVDRDEWRREMLKLVNNLNKQLSDSLQPFEITTVNN